MREISSVLNLLNLSNPEMKTAAALKAYRSVLAKERDRAERQRIISSKLKEFEKQVAEQEAALEAATEECDAASLKCGLGEISNAEFQSVLKRKTSTSDSLLATREIVKHLADELTKGIEDNTDRQQVFVPLPPAIVAREAFFIAVFEDSRASFITSLRTLSPTLLPTLYLAFVSLCAATQARGDWRAFLSQSLQLPEPTSDEVDKLYREIMSLLEDQSASE